MAFPQAAPGGPRSFTIENDRFMKDGEPFLIRSGSIHYSRIPRAYWRDRLERVRALGLNTITTLVFWNFHEEKEGVVDFDGQRDLKAWLELAHELELLVILRPGPYVCAEWDMGGFPAWLLQKENIKLRTYNEPYMAAVRAWFSHLWPILRPQLYSNGGPIVLVQIENEYGSYGNVVANPDDARYMYALYDMLAENLGTEVLYSTIDGGEDGAKTKLVVESGSPWKGNASVLSTVDGSVKADYGPEFDVQRQFNAPGHSPKMWSELWVGWFDYWGSGHQSKWARDIHDGVLAMAKTEGASFSLYMAHGGTSGNWPGANAQVPPGGVEPAGAFQPDVTSYDYSAPVNEAGHHGLDRSGGDLFVAVQSAISQVYGPPPFPEPAQLPVVSYGAIELHERAMLLDSLEVLSTCKEDVAVNRSFPTFEELGLDIGLAVYEAARPAGFDRLDVPAYFTTTSLHDFAQVLVDGLEVAAAYRADLQQDAALLTPAGKRMDLIVENVARVNYGSFLSEHKGLHQRPPLSGPWTARCVPLEAAPLDKLPWQPVPPEFALPSPAPAFRRGVLRVDGTPQDTFIDSRRLGKGYMWVNGTPLGRFWEAKGPQHTLYVPAPYLRSGDNELVVFDFHDQGGARLVETAAAPRWEPWAEGDAEAQLRVSWL